MYIDLIRHDPIITKLYRLVKPETIGYVFGFL